MSKKSIIQIMKEMSAILVSKIPATPPVPCATGDWCKTFSTDTKKLEELWCRKPDTKEKISHDRCLFSIATFYLIKSLEHEMEAWIKQNSTSEYTFSVSISPSTVCKRDGQTCGKPVKLANNNWQSLIGIEIDYTIMSSNSRVNENKFYIYDFQYTPEGKTISGLGKNAPPAKIVRGGYQDLLILD